MTDQDRQDWLITLGILGGLFLLAFVVLPAHELLVLKVELARVELAQAQVAP